MHNYFYVNYFQTQTAVRFFGLGVAVRIHLPVEYRIECGATAIKHIAPSQFNLVFVIIH